MQFKDRPNALVTPVLYDSSKHADGIMIVSVVVDTKVKGWRDEVAKVIKEDNRSWESKN